MHAAWDPMSTQGERVEVLDLGVRASEFSVRTRLQKHRSRDKVSEGPQYNT